MESLDRGYGVSRGERNVPNMKPEKTCGAEWGMSSRLQLRRPPTPRTTY